MCQAVPSSNHHASVAPSEDSRFTADLAELMPTLRSYARRLCRDEESSADLAQETLAKAWQARGTFAPGTNLKAWLFTIMHNHFRSELRRSWRQMPWDEAAAETISAPPAEQLSAVELGDVTRAINTLPTRQRAALILSTIGDLSSQDAGAILSCRPAAAKNRVFRARAAVAAMLDGRKKIRWKRNRRDTIADLFGQLSQLTGAAPRSGSANVATV